MKNFKILFVIFLVVLISISGCSSNSNEKDLPANGSNVGENKQEEIKDEDDKNSENNENNEEIKNPENNVENSSNNADDVTIEKEEEAGEIETKEAENNQNQETNNNDKKENDGSVDTEETVETEDETNLLKIEGLVENKLVLTLDELKAMDELIFKADFYSLNSFGTTGYTNFKGVNLWNLLDSKAGISEEATKISVIAQDGYKMEFTIDQVEKQDYIDETNPDTMYPMIIAWEENGEEYSAEEGAPFKLVIGQTEAGDVNKPQWVSTVDKIVVE